MAFGFNPKYTQDMLLDELSSGQFLTIMLEAMKNLKWNISYAGSTGLIAFTDISLSSWSEQVKVKIEDGVAHLKSECTGSQLADWGENKDNIEELIAEFNRLKALFTPEELEQKLSEFQAAAALNEGDALEELPQNTKEKLSGVLAFFKPTNGYFVTPIIIDLNIAIFMLMVISGVNILTPDNESIINWGANFTPLTLEGQWWRLITNCFIHIGVLHLLFNMYALLYIGLLLEPHLGRARFTAAYLLTGITASITSLWWHNLTISAGASGAIFGLYGVFLAMLTTNLIDKATRKALLTSISIFVGYNLLNGMKEGIDNAAHLGGLVGGLVIGYAFVPSLKKSDDYNLKISNIALLTLLVLIGGFIVGSKIPNEIGKYDTRIKQFATNESMAMEVYQMPKDSPKEKILSEINDRGLYYWNENIKLLNSLDSLNLPQVLHERDRKLIAYCKLRIECYNLLYKAINENTEQYKPQIEDYDKQIQAIINDLSSKTENK